MAAELHIDGDDHRLMLSGELDTHTTPQLETRLAAVAGGSALVLDLSGVGFICSAALSAILNAQRRLEESGGSLAVEQPAPAVARVIELSGLNEKFGLS